MSTASAGSGTSMGLAAAAYVQGQAGGDARLAAAVLEVIGGDADLAERGCARSMRKIAQKHSVRLGTLLRHVKEAREKASGGVARAVAWAAGRSGSRLSVAWAELSQVLEWLSEREKALELYRAYQLAGVGEDDPAEVLDQLERMARAEDPSWKARRLPEDSATSAQGHMAHAEGGGA